VRLTVVALLAVTVLPWHGFAVTGSVPHIDVEDDPDVQGVGPQARMGFTSPYICPPNGTNSHKPRLSSAHQMQGD